ncbi:3-hydroxyacyl-CoA dehydrogenase, partial [Roseomonas sp. SSH11]
MAQQDPVSTSLSDGLLLVTISNPPVNALSSGVRVGLLRAVELAGADASVRAVVIGSEGRTFIAGADISEFGKPPVPPGLSEV